MPRLAVLALLCTTLAAATAADQARPPALANAPLLHAVDGAWHWGNEAVAFAADGDGALVTAAGLVRLDPAYAGSDDQALVTALAALVEHATAAGLRSDDRTWLFRPSLMVGPYLAASDALVVAAGALVDDDEVVAIDDGALKAAITSAAAALGPDLARLEPVARRSVEETLDLLDDEGLGMGLDEVTPDFARRVVRHGWLQEVLPPGPRVDALAQAVADAMAVRARRRFTGPGLEVVIANNVFGQELKAFRSDQGVRVSLPMPIPMFHWPLQKRGGFDDALVVVDLAPDTDPYAIATIDPATITQAILYHDESELARWSPETGLVVDDKRWRAVVRAKGRDLDGDVVADYLPPHLVIASPVGDILAIAVPSGLLIPPRDGTRAEGERFIADAARLLPDAAHLDLITQYLFKYVYDSPDPGTPGLMGSERLKGEIHQTAWQTLASAAGGVCRGDCDDLSELFEHIVDRQGKTSHVISLPQHAALAWAEQRGDRWHTYVMQTGPTLEFVADELPESLRKAYTSFDASEIFDPNGLGLLLRFSGENTRSAWRLSWRIFSEPDYAATMIDVQKDWHYQTYLQAIEKMLRMIEEGDEDTANFRELSGLYSFTGQYDKAAQYHQWAIERTTEADSRLFMNLELVGHLLEAGREEEAETLATRLLDEDVPALASDLGPVTVQVGLDLARALAAGHRWELAGRALAELTGDFVGPLTDNLANWSRNSFDQRSWDLNAQIAGPRRLLHQHAGMCLAIVSAGGLERIVGKPAHTDSWAATETWLAAIAFNDSADPSGRAMAYAQAGIAGIAIFGEERFLAMLTATSLPVAASRADHRKRQPGTAQLVSDLPWIKASVPFWTGLLAQAYERQVETVDRERLQMLAGHLRTAIDATRALDETDAQLESQVFFGRLAAAIALEDPAEIRDLLTVVAAKNDKNLRDRSAMMIGDMARTCTEAWFDQILDAWVDLVDYKPKYLWIAWRAALNRAESAALKVAEVAAERFADDPAFVAEERFMRELFAGGQ